MKNKYELVDIMNDVAHLGYSCTMFALRTFYGVSNLDALRDGLNEYMIERFSSRLEYFISEHKYLSDEEKKLFYDDLKGNKRNLNYLYEFIEKTRTTTYDLHAKLLARLSVELIYNRQLTYNQSTLLANIDILNEHDIYNIYKFLKEVKASESEVNFKIDTFEMSSTYNKCIQLNIIKPIDAGILYFKDMPPLRDKTCYLTDFSLELHDMLEEILNEEHK